MRRSVFAIMFLCTVLSAGMLAAATPGMTTAGRDQARELQRALVAKRLPRKLTRSLTQIYLRRAYAIDVEPAKSMVGVLLRKELRLKEEEQTKYFAMCLDALIRGANMKDLLVTVRDVMKADYGKKDNALFIESCLSVASRQASPVPIASALQVATKGGMVGRRRREFLTWIIDTVKRGENPKYILMIYGGIGKTIFSSKRQREYMQKCYGAIRRGAPPLALSTAIVRIAKQLQTGRQLNDKTDQILALYFRGMPLTAAAARIVPPPKIIKKDDLLEGL